MVFPAKYRKEIFSDKVTESLKDICLGISHCYEIHFVEIGSDDDHVHFLVQSVSSLSVSRVATIVKSITVCEVFSRHKEVKKYCGVVIFGQAVSMRIPLANMPMRKASKNTSLAKEPIKDFCFNS